MYKSLRAQTLLYLARPHEGRPAGAVEGPAAWRGADLAGRDDWQIRLTTAQTDECLAAVERAQSGGKPLHRIGRDDLPLPTLAPVLAACRDQVRHGRGFVLIRGVPVARWTERQTELFYWGLGHHLGIPGAQNAQGDLLGHVRDQRSGGDIRYYRTNRALDMHCDAADMVGLLCLRKARSGGVSRIASSVAVYNELQRRDPEMAARLFEPFWFDTKGEGGIPAYPVVPCRYADGELRTFWQSDYFRTVEAVPHVPRLGPAEHALLDAYDAIANDPAFRLDMDLEPGDLQLLSNHSVLHARAAFEDWPEPERRRHLLRLWITLPDAPRPATRLRRLASLLAVSGTAARELLRTRLRRLAPAAPAR